VSKPRDILKAVASLVVGLYFVSVFVFVPYYNWQFARDHGFLAWFFFGEIIPTGKALVWPYFMFFADRGASTTKDGARISEYTDNQYNFAFQFPADWKFQKPPAPGEAGEVRVLLQSTRKNSSVMALVGHVGRSITKEQFENSPNRDTMLTTMIDFTVDQVYKKASRDIGASRMIVSEKRPLPSDVGIKFYISTGSVVENGMVAVAGIHVIPFGKDYMVTFLMIHPVNRNATAENETMEQVFNSFHLVGEPPR
jgi:hypothetical protein